MQSLGKFSVISLRRSWKAAAMLVCVLLISTQSGFGETRHNADQEGGTIVEHKQVEKTMAGSYHYQSHYEMTKDRNGNYHSTYQSDKREWFCCFHLFSEEKVVSIHSD